jgi:hypothetical protein
VRLKIAEAKGVFASFHFNNYSYSLPGPEGCCILYFIILTNLTTLRMHLNYIFGCTDDYL